MHSFTHSLALTLLQIQYKANQQKKYKEENLVSFFKFTVYQGAHICIRLQRAWFQKGGVHTQRHRTMELLFFLSGSWESETEHGGVGMAGTLGGASPVHLPVGGVDFIVALTHGLEKPVSSALALGNLYNSFCWVNLAKAGNVQVGNEKARNESWCCLVFFMYQTPY